jgi:hypothetical protein
MSRQIIDLIQFAIKKASPQARERIAKALDSKLGLDWYSQKMMPMRAIERDGVPHLLVYRGTSSGGRESMVRPEGQWTGFKPGEVSTSTNRKIAKRFQGMWGKGDQPALGTYAIPEHELGKVSAHLGEQEVRHPEMAKFLVRARSGSTKLSALLPVIQFGSISIGTAKKVLRELRGKGSKASGKIPITREHGRAGFSVEKGINVPRLEPNPLETSLHEHGHYASNRGAQTTL